MTLKLVALAVMCSVSVSGCATLPPTEQVIKSGLDVLQCVEPAIVALQHAREAEAQKAVAAAAVAPATPAK